MSYKAHVFVCTNLRPAKPGEKVRESCAVKGAEELRGVLKDWAKAEYGRSVRINASGCLDQCEKGIACVVYPQDVWMTEVQSTDSNKIKNLLKKLIK